ncbi:MAG: hypothetical protein IPH20_03070 [Bacteroidales bacterium]|nr:hypothetical protein [Bacteroidales bacterium]
MKKIELSPKIYIVIGMIFTGAIMRLIPHWHNFTPVAAIALFGGTFLKRKDLAFLVPVSAMLLSDLIIGFHSTMLPVYFSFIAIVGIGMVLQSRLTVMNTISASLAASFMFYLVTNFASWISGFMPYPMNVAGLLQSYIAGLPFFFNGLLGDLFYTSVFFGAVYLKTKGSTIILNKNWQH